MKLHLLPAVLVSLIGISVQAVETTYEKYEALTYQISPEQFPGGNRASVEVDYESDKLVLKISGPGSCPAGRPCAKHVLTKSWSLDIKKSVLDRCGGATLVAETGSLSESKDYQRFDLRKTCKGAVKGTFVVVKKASKLYSQSKFDLRLVDQAGYHPEASGNYVLLSGYQNSFLPDSIQLKEGSMSMDGEKIHLSVDYDQCGEKRCNLPMGKLDVSFEVEKVSSFNCGKVISGEKSLGPIKEEIQVYKYDQHNPLCDSKKEVEVVYTKSSIFGNPLLPVKEVWTMTFAKWSQILRPLSK